MRRKRRKKDIIGWIIFYAAVLALLALALYLAPAARAQTPTPTPWPVIWEDWPSLVARWSFDEGEGLTAYDTAGAHDGTFTNLTENAWTSETAKFGSALRFSAFAEQYIDCGGETYFNYQSDFTVVGWVYPLAHTNTYSSIFGTWITWNEGGWFTYIRTNSLLRTYFYTTDEVVKDVSSTAGVFDEVWQFVAWVYHSDTSTIWVDDGSTTSAATDMSVQTSDQSFKIGGMENAALLSVNGYIDEVNFFDRALTDNELSQIMNNATPTPSPTPAYGTEWMALSDVSAMSIDELRAGDPTGWLIDAKPGDLSVTLARVRDSSQAFTSYTDLAEEYPLAMVVTSYNEDRDIHEGDFVRLTGTDDTGEVTKRIWFPEVTGSGATAYYVGEDGATYTDRWLNNLAKAVPSPTPAYGTTWMALSEVSAASINETRATVANGYWYRFFDDEDETEMGRVRDNNQVFSYYEALPVERPLMVSVFSYDSDLAIQQGDFIRLTGASSEGEVTKWIWFTGVTGPTGDDFWVGADGATYYDRWLTDLAQPVPSPTPSADWLFLSEVTAMSINQTRSTEATGWFITMMDAATLTDLARVRDNNQVYTKYSVTGLAEPMAVKIAASDEARDIHRIDFFRLTGTGDGGEVTRSIYLPKITGSGATNLYIADDGATYYDRWLRELAQAVPVPTPIADIYNGFDSFELGMRKPGWTYSGIGNSDIFLNAYYYGLNQPAIQLADSGDWFITEDLVGSTRELAYWMRESGGNEDSILKIDGYEYSEGYYYWTTIQELQPLPQVETSTSGIYIMDDVLKLRFTYTKDVGQLAFDDFQFDAVTPSPTPTPVGYLTPTPTPVVFQTPSPTITPVPSPSPMPTPSPTPDVQQYDTTNLPFQFKGVIDMPDTD